MDKLEQELDLQIEEEDAEMSPDVRDDNGDCCAGCVGDCHTRVP
ncbi:hypothetical protein [Glycomyces tenuis]|nr:hypothetical protein [Glycomyces tenuis]